jgi:TRAP-type C4-dicarboxylate transport system permease small subunit
LNLLHRLTSRLSDAAAVAVAVMTFLTIADIVMKNLFHRPVSGTFELVELALVFAVFLGMPEIFRAQTNIVVDIVDHLCRPAVVKGFKIAGALVTLCFLVLLGWAVCAPAWDTVDFPQYTQEAGVSLTVFWIPILAGIALSILCTIAVVVRLLRRNGRNGQGGSA